MLIIFFQGYFKFYLFKSFIFINLLILNFIYLSNGFSCPANYNPAEHFIKILAISPFDKENCLQRVKVYIFYSLNYFEYNINLRFLDYL